MIRRIRLVILVLVALGLGLFIRYYAWTHSQGWRFDGDISNALHWGNFVIQHGWVNAYDEIAKSRDASHYGLDYTPMRLLTASLWARYVGAQTWKPADAWPMLGFNTVCEIVSAVGMYLLVRRWTRNVSAKSACELRESHPSPLPSPARGEEVATVPIVSALLLWFDPSIILNGHVFPQWDVWLLPFYIFAAYCCSIDRWLIAGALVAVGGMFKGQVYTIAALFVLWPLFQLRFKAILKFATGFLIAGLIVISPFLLHGSMNWYRIGFRYPLDHFQVPAAGTVWNLPAILARRFDWRLYDVVFGAITFQRLMRWVFFVSLVLCAIGLAKQSKRNSRETLLGFATPWLLLFAIAPQMHCRYLVWGAAITCIAPALGGGFVLLHFLVTAISVGMILQTLLMVNPETAPNLYQALKGFDPDFGWVILLVALIHLYALLRGQAALVRLKKPMEATVAAM